mgnify:CR=1 FL=1
MFTSWLFPRGKLCVWCRRPVGRELFCNQCRRQLHSWQNKYRPCKHCGRLLPVTGNEMVCQQCREVLPVFKKARAVGPYQGLLKEMIRSLKYQGRRSLAAPLGRLMAGVVVNEPAASRPDLVVPVPLTATRLQARGFNQAELLARALGHEIGLPIDSVVLQRIKETAPQVKLSRKYRWDNLSGAFKVIKPETVAGRYLLLVDDVLTTGATASACTQSLLLAGAARVTVVTLATGVEHNFQIST